MGWRWGCLFPPLTLGPVSKAAGLLFAALHTGRLSQADLNNLKNMLDQFGKRSATAQVRARQHAGHACCKQRGKQLAAALLFAPCRA